MPVISNSELEESLSSFLKDKKSDHEAAPAPDDFNLQSLSQNNMADLVRFKRMRSDMVAQKADLEARIRIMDKRIEIALATVTTLQKPV